MSVFSHGILCCCFFKAVSVFLCCCPLLPQKSLLYALLVLFLLVSQSLSLTWGSRIFLSTSSGVRGTHHHPGFPLKSSVEQTPFFMLAREAHYQLSHLPVHPSFFLLSLSRRQTSYLSGSQEKNNNNKIPQT